MKPSVLVLGSGPIRIGQGIEFDYSCVHCVWALQQMGYRAILINNNPETVSTDFDTGDALYFEPVTADDVVKVAQNEGVIGVVCQFGGQTAINLSEELERRGIPVLGTSPEAIAAAEDRDRFEALLTELDIPKPPGRAVRSLAEAQEVALEIGYPVLVRPSFVLGGRAMEIVYEPSQLEGLFAEAEAANPGQPVLVDRYLSGTEAEVDAISDGLTALCPGLMEHVERAGVHSGDSMAVYPPQTISHKVQAQMVDYAQRLAIALKVKGMINVQFVLDGEQAYVIEVNPRASRTVPYLSKVTGIPMVQLATRTMMGVTLAELGYPGGLWCSSGKKPDGDPSPYSPRVSGKVVTGQEYGKGEIAQGHLVAVKAPVFSFQKLQRVEPSLGPEMKSTGEVLGVDSTYEGALYKALIASHVTFKPGKHVVLTLNDRDKERGVEVAKRLHDAGYSLAATSGTHRALELAGIPALRVHKIQEDSPSLLDLITSGEVSLMINTPDLARTSTQEAMRIRRACIESGIVCLTNIDTAEALSRSIGYYDGTLQADCRPYHEYLVGAVS